MAVIQRKDSLKPFKPKITITLLVAFCGLLVLGNVWPGSDTLPTRLEDPEFRSLIEALSEPEGYFRSDNLVSNEANFQQIIPSLLQRTKFGGAYLGVGPEQNFSYIAALKPKIAFILDIRRGNLNLHLMYKAVFELSEDRADFVSRLFTMKRPPNIPNSSSASQIFDAFLLAKSESETVHVRNLNAIKELLTKKRDLRLSEDALSEIGSIYRRFYSYGPQITYYTGPFKSPEWYPSYLDLMTNDHGLENLSYLADETSFRFVKTLEEKNLIIPVVGDFAGPKTIRAIGGYLREHHATVSAFYVSNVEHYIEDVRNDFCSNVASLPLDANSTFIRWLANQHGVSPILGSMMEETTRCADTH